ncbi:hypothetical protein B0H16DRAFT_1475971 [Mycena metata]|uniref:Uncharacterized protein n=1 Tax=Mycena metata TaxID=1033252 RepID=A0AAD7HDD2_9AGAR|nr:hypothetical protein B0H16DRAFT_1475971 [Mycena metata]
MRAHWPRSRHALSNLVRNHRFEGADEVLPSADPILMQLQRQRNNMRCMPRNEEGHKAEVGVVATYVDAVRSSSVPARGTGITGSSEETNLEGKHPDGRMHEAHLLKHRWVRHLIVAQDTMAKRGPKILSPVVQQRQIPSIWYAPGFLDRLRARRFAMSMVAQRTQVQHQRAPSATSHATGARFRGNIGGLAREAVIAQKSASDLE